jgi:hypothetical protein
MTYKDECIAVLSRLKSSAPSKFEEASVFRILSTLKGGESAASFVSSDLLTLNNSSQEFSNEYTSFLINYDIREIMDEGVSFGLPLTVVVDMDTERSHKVQLCEGCDEDFGGLNVNGDYSFFNILMHYPSNASIYDYVEGRLSSKFPNASISRTPR